MARNTNSKSTILVIMSMMFLLTVLSVSTASSSNDTRSDTTPQWPTFKGSDDHSGRSEFNIAQNSGEVLWKKWTSPVMNSSITPDQESEGNTDWTGLICCFIVLFGVIGFPIILIIIISKAFKATEGKKQTKNTWTDRFTSKEAPATSKPVRIDIGKGSDPASWTMPSQPMKEPEASEDGSFDAIDWEGQGIDLDTIPVEDDEDDEDEDPIEMDIQTPYEEEEMPIELQPDIIFKEPEPDLSSFERPSALSDEEKDEFIVERIMELREMLNDGEIDKEMYETLRKRLVDQLDE